jgi:hypothetical protein
MVSNDVPLSKLAWVIGNSREKHALYFEYSLIMGPKKKYNGMSIYRKISNKYYLGSLSGF